MADRHENFEDLMNIELFKYENKICKICVFISSRFTIMQLNIQSLTQKALGNFQDPINHASF